MPLKSIAPKGKTKKKSLKFLKKIIDDDPSNLKSDSNSTIGDSEPGLMMEPAESAVKMKDLESDSTEKAIESSAAEIVANVIHTVTTETSDNLQNGTEEQKSNDIDTREMVKHDVESEIVTKAKNIKPKRRKSSKKVQIKSQPHVIELKNDEDGLGDEISGSQGDSLSGSHGDSLNDHHGDQTPNSPPLEEGNISSSPDGLETMNDLRILYGKKKKKFVRKRSANSRRKPKNTEEVNRAINKKLEQKYGELEDILMQQVIEKRKPIRQQHGQPPLLIRKQQGSHGDQYRSPVPPDRRETRKVQPIGLPPRAKLREIAVRDISESEDNSSDRQRVVVSRSGNNIDDGDSALDNTESQTDSISRHRKRTLSADLSKNQRSHSADNPRKPFVPTDNQLGNTENEYIQEWLKKKTKLIRHERSKERAKKRDEHRIAVLQANDRFTKRMESQKYYDNWMEKKKKEVQEKSKKDKVLLKEYEESMKKKPVPPEVRPRSVRLMVPHSRSSLNASSTFSSIDVDVALDDSIPKDVRESTASARLHDDEEKQKEKAKKAADSGLRVRQTKFVYKRPVTGKIRLKPARKSMKEADNRRAQSSRSQGELGVRMSYDQWVTRKRKEDADKKRRIERERELSKSDPELANLLPDLAKRRIDRIMDGKKYIDTGLDKINHQVNGAFGGGGNKSASSDDDKNENEESNQGKTDNYLWLNDRINWDGKKVEKNVSTFEVTFDSDNGERPQSAIGFRAPMPKQSRSPRRPESARATVVNETEVHVNSYTLPFPPDLGVPKNVAARQRAIFAQEVGTKYEEETRPEPQGCDAVIESKCSKQVSFTEPPSTPIPNKSPISSISSDGSDQITKPTESSEKPEAENAEQRSNSQNIDKIFLTTVNVD